MTNRTIVPDEIHAEFQHLITFATLPETGGHFILTPLSHKFLCCGGFTKAEANEYFFNATDSDGGCWRLSTEAALAASHRIAKNRTNPDEARFLARAVLSVEERAADQYEPDNVNLKDIADLAHAERALSARVASNSARDGVAWHVSNIQLSNGDFMAQGDPAEYLDAVLADD